MAETSRPARFARDVVVIGGCGHVGLPLAIAFASRGLRVGIYDISEPAVACVNSGTMPFAEPGARPALEQAIGAGTLVAATDPAIVGTGEHVIVVIGTPVGENLEPDQAAIPNALRACTTHLAAGQILILRSTVYPGVTARVEKMVAGLGLDIDVAFCPERIAEGQAMTELFELPQIVSSRSARGMERASRLFRRLTPTLVAMTPEEAELAKLFTNVWRYIKFATANQLYMMANDRGLDFERIRQGLALDYPRAADMPGAGFAAGPCLFKDTMQLAAFNVNGFSLGHAAMAINEALPSFLVANLKQRYKLDETRVGILGMAFKADIDDIRDSLSYKLGKVLRFDGAEVFYSDEFARDPTFITKEELVERCDVVIVGVPHSAYRTLVIPERVEVVDLWGVIRTNRPVPVGQV